MKATNFIDMHTDMINIFSCLNMEKNQKADFGFFINDSQINIDYLKNSNTKIIFSSSLAYYESQFCIGNNFFENTLYTLNLNKRIIKDNEIFELISNSKDIKKICEKGKIGFLLHVEGLYGIRNKYMIDTLYDLGVRSIGLIWNEDSNIGGSCRQGNNYGLSKFGRTIVEYIEEKGMILDLAHAGDLLFDHVMNIIKKPVIVSHTAIRSLNNYDRNITDEQMIKIKNSGGLIGISCNPFFLNGSMEADIQEYVNHIRYAVDLIGINHVGIGTDFEGMGQDITPKGFQSINDVCNLQKALIKNGFSDENIDKILNKNAINFISKII